MPVDEDSMKKSEAFHFPIKYGSQFPVFIGPDSLENIFDIKAYPAIVLIKKGQQVYKGNLELALPILDKIANEN